MGIFDSPVNRGIGYGLPGGEPRDPSQIGGGILGGYQQQPGWTSTLGILSAALKDAGANFSGHPADANALQTYSAQMQQNQIRQQLLQGLQSSDPAIQKQAAMYAAARGIDPSPLLNLSRPKIEHVGDDLVSIDPFDPGNPKTIRKGEAAPPSGYDRNPDGSLKFIVGGPADPSVINGRRPPPVGYNATADGKGLTFIPGGPGDPRVAAGLAGARRKPSPLGGGPLGNPASLFGGR